jgi:hypothetical protein
VGLVLSRFVGAMRWGAEVRKVGNKGSVYTAVGGAASSVTAGGGRRGRGGTRGKAQLLGSEVLGLGGVLLQHSGVMEWEGELKGQ